MMRVLDYWGARELLGLVLDEAGRDYVYQPDTVDAGSCGPALCRYRHCDEPGCLVAWVLTAAGWTLDELDVVEDTTPTAGDLSAFGISAAAVRLWADRTTYGARRLLAEVQRGQDSGLCWGDAVDRALDAVPSPPARVEAVAA